MPYQIKPEKHELRKARRIVEETLEKCRYSEIQENENVDVDIGWSSDQYTKQKLNGVYGFTHSQERFEINFNSNVEGWEDQLKASVAHEYAHTVFFNTVPRQDLKYNWQHILMEAHSQLFAEKIFPDIEIPWREKYSLEELRDYWPKIKETLKQEIGDESQLFFGGKHFPEWLGYSLSYRLGKELMKEHDLEDIPELKHSDILETGEKLLGGK